MFNSSVTVTVARAASIVAVGAALLGSVAGVAQAQPGVAFDARVGECVTLGGIITEATIAKAACGSPASNYRVIGKGVTKAECVADRDNWYAQTVDGVPVVALCLDIDWVVGGCMDTGGEVPRRVGCLEPAGQKVLVVGIHPDTTDVGVCLTDVGYKYPERRFVVCVQEL